MSVHTPGLWTFYEDNNYGGTVELGSSGATVTVDRADRFTSDLVISRDEMRANGRLIAVSPDLLEHIRVMMSVHCPQPGPECGVCEHARALISRAEGQP